MLSKEELLQFGELLEPIYKKLDTIETKMVTKSHLDANNRIIGTMFKIDLAEIVKV